MLAVADFGHRVDERAAAEAAVRHHRLDALEVGEDLLARRRVGRRDVLEARGEVRGNEVVLGRVVVVQRALADAGLGGDGVDADRADALLVEQLVGGGEDALGVGGRLMHRSVYFALDSIVCRIGS